MISKFSANLSKVFSLVSMVVLDILSYHISEKSMPLPLLILFSVVMTLISLVESSLELIVKETLMALIQRMESVGSPEKSAGRAALNSGVDNDIGVGGLGGTRLLGVDCLLIPKGWVGTMAVNDVGMRLGLRG